MGKAKQKKKNNDIKRRKMLEEVFKKGKKQREIAKKFDDKIAQRQGISKKRDKFQALKQQKVSTFINNLYRSINGFISLYQLAQLSIFSSCSLLAYYIWYLSQKKESNSNRNQVDELNKKFDEIRANRKPGSSIF
jgi:polyhydroxyalkanoate synthesis regulator phasin